MKKILFCLILILGFSSCKDAVSDDELTLKEILNKAVSEGFIGISCYTVKSEVTEYETAGLTDLDGDAVNQDSLFRICSLSKMYYGAAISILIAENHLDEEALISNYLPEELINNLTNGNIITLHQLLHHSSGLYDYLNNDSDDFSLAVYDDLTKFWTIEETLTFVYGKPATNNPGDKFNYSNTNYLLLPLIIESVVEGNFYDFIRERIIDPLELSNTYLDTLEEYDREKLVHGYYSDNITGLIDIHSTYGDMPGDGGIVSTPFDVYKFIKSVIQNESFPSTETREAFLEAFLPHEAALDINSTPDTYGAGIKAIDFSGDGENLCYTHTGGFPGYSSILYYFPQRSKAFCVTFNIISSDENEAIENETAQELLSSIFRFLEL